ncbi:MAG: D-glycero-beta-D-manno-heptose 1-phosphate adenylyltransferase [Chloroflexi bacterium]|nr:D-glycero-beta-D-manno-heptose 1-phosphate adenylyltransferase [Chloroflexota bacterium]
MTAAKILSESELQRQVDALRQQGKVVVFTNGCFDLLHAGHVAYLERARALGDALVVAVNSDRSVRALKGPTRPITRARDRSRLLAALACVDWVIVFDDDTAERLLSKQQPDIYVKGGDYTRSEPVEAATVREYGGSVRILPFTAGYSTTDLLQRIIANEEA